MLSKKDYSLIAEQIWNAQTLCIYDTEETRALTTCLISELSKAFQIDNSNFDKQKFINSCNNLTTIK